MSAYSYFPGCSLTSTAIEYDTSFRLVAEEFGIGLDMLEDWNCCGASPAPHHWGGNLGVFLPARNLHIAGAGHQAMVAPCAGCYTRHKYAQQQLVRNEEHRTKVENALHEPLRYQTRIMNIIELFNEEIDPEEMSRRARSRLENVRLGTYYGCVLTRPAEVLGFDDPKDPVSMEPLLAATGAEIPYFPFKTECCGSYMGLAKKEIVLRASRRIIEVALECGIDALVTACPLCHQNLDLRQGQINRAFGTKYELPVLYLSQALGLGLGMAPEELGIDAHAVGIGRVMRKMAEAEAQESENEARRQRPAGAAGRSPDKEAARQASPAGTAMARDGEST
ncbi:MAG: CoB--CoM heterodisulfide reductase iron-sulfur subunit B family protein [Thermoleophilia bacterium]|nr:CoB--CoM heterodisulfide reductase iron-sulfur subunit B family protein [Thermoleophilia bacterium]